MRLNLKVLVPGVIIAGLLSGWLVGIWATPYLATDAMFSRFVSNGAKSNTLSKAPLRTAKTAKVVADNADTLTRSSMLDLGDGPLLLDVELPTKSAYWSVSLFAHNTDTFYVGNDQTIETAQPGRFRLAIKLADQNVPDGIADAIAISPSRTGFLIIRATMPDRTDPVAVKELQDEVLQSRLQRLEISG